MDLPKDLLEKGLVYDIETFPNLFSVVAYSLRYKKWREYLIYPEGGRDDQALLKRDFKDRYLVGYNSSNFDDGLIELILRSEEPLGTQELYDFAMTLFTERNPFKYTYSGFARSYDLLEIIRAGFNTISLKGVGVNLKFPTIQEFEFEYGKPIKADKVEELLRYNRNDVEITLALLEAVSHSLNMREKLSELYGVPVYCTSDSGIAKRLLNYWYQKEARLSKEQFKGFRYRKTERNVIPMSDVIHDYIEFKTPTLQSFLEKLKTKTIKKIKSTKARDKFGCDIPTVSVGGVKLSVGLGGIHSKDSPLKWKKSGEEILLDLDVASQYPMAILNNKICPEHVDPDVFLPLLEKIVKERLYHKPRKNISAESDLIQSALKITINAIYGFLNSKTYWLFDPKGTFEVAVNNQLLILELLESLAGAGFEIVSANTDGVLVKCKQSEIEAVRKIYKPWESKSGFELEEAELDLYIRRDVNNYLSRSGGKVKLKGCFVPQGGLIKGYQYPVVGKALQAYYLEGVEVEDFLKNHKDIYDFCASQKVGKQFTNILEEVERSTRFYGNSGKLKNPNHDYKVIKSSRLQNTVRFYVSEPERKFDTFYGKRLRKLKDDGSFKDYCAGWFITLFNNYFEAEDYKIEYRFYSNLINQEIAKIEGSDFEKEYYQSHSEIHSKQLELPLF